MKPRIRNVAKRVAAWLNTLIRRVQTMLARRLVSVFPVVLPGIGERGLELRSRFEIASARDVFCSANYWRLFEHLDRPPRLIVDLGAHCGHFAVLATTLIRERFGKDAAKYILVEPIAALVEVAERSVSQVGLREQVQLIRGLVGRAAGAGRLGMCSKNLLVSSTVASTFNTDRWESAPYIDIDALIPAEEETDVLKCDIEGSEYELIKTSPGLFSRARLLVIELHGDRGIQDTALHDLRALGFFEASPSIANGREQLLLLRRGEDDRA